MGTPGWALASAAFLLAAAATWAVPANLAAASAASTHGEPQSASLDVARNESVSFRWDVNVDLRDPALVDLRVFLPVATQPTAAASRGANVWAEVVVNGASASGMLFKSGTRGGVEWAEVPSAGTYVDWSALRPGANAISVFTNFSIPSGEFSRTGQVTVSAGPLEYRAAHRDADSDGVADVLQPVRFMPTYVLAALAGISAAGGAVYIKRRLR